MRSRSNYDRYFSLGEMREGVVAGITNIFSSFIWRDGAEKKSRLNRRGKVVTGL